MATAFVFFVVENAPVAATPICSQTQMQKAMENSCYFYTREKKIKHHPSDLNFAKTVKGNKIRVATCLKDLEPAISTRGKYSRYWTTGRGSSGLQAMDYDSPKSNLPKSNTKLRLNLLIFKKMGM